jgi:hypothetical protein
MTGRANLNAKVAFYLFCLTLLGLPSEGARAATLIGTIVTSGVETIPQMNQLIADYNADFGALLPPVVALVDKLEGQDAADFTEGNLALSDFQFYQQDNGGSTSLNLFDATVKFTTSTLGSTAGFDTLDNRVYAFDQLSGASFAYYVSKDGALGWSLWVPTASINPVYTDAGTGSSSITGSGFTRGSTTNNSLDYDPITNGVSHISFYDINDPLVVPEPASLLLTIFCLGLCSWPRCGKLR